ncbi:MAG: RHS repeat-associated core domain-containing protein [Anaerolineae bacterium]|nr:MAG: RHS repeat-associated core domain-containing protein [Anaerolineae bacterium]
MLLMGYSLDEAVDRDQVSTTAYDAMGRVIRTAGPDGRVTLYGYDPLGRQVKTIRSASQPDYDSTADPALSGYPPGNSPDEDLITCTAYDEAGRTLYTEDVNGRRTWLAYDGLGRQVKTIVNAVGTATDGGVNDPRSSAYAASSAADKDLISETRYDTEGRVKWTKDVLGRYTLFGYDDFSRQVRVIRHATDPDYPTELDADLSNYTLSSLPDEDVMTRAVYDHRGRVEKTIDSRGNEIHYQYDSLGRRQAVVVNYEDGIFNSDYPDEDLITETLYNAQGRPGSQIDPAGRRTEYFYDKMGRVIKTIRNFADGIYDDGYRDEDLITETSYNKGGQVLQVTDVRGTKTAFTYDSLGRRRTVTDAAGTALAVIHYTCYDRAGRALRTIQNWIDEGISPEARDEQGDWLFNPTDHGLANDLNLITEFVCDRLGRVIKMINPAGDEALKDYGRDSQILAMTDPENAVTIQRYDQVGRLRRVVRGYLASGEDPALWVWDNVDGRWEKSDGTPLGHGDANDRNLIVDTTYDKAGHPLEQRNPRGYLTTYQYDGLDRRTQLADIHTWHTAYTDLPDGSLKITLTDPMSFETERRFDRMGRLKEITYLDETPKVTPDVTFTYDRTGNRIKMSETDSSLVRETHYTYDQVRRLTQVGFDTDGDAVVDETVSYFYDAGGLRVAIVLPDERTISYVYNELGQLTRLNDWYGRPTFYFYDGTGRLQRVEPPLPMYTNYRYDPAGRLRDIHYSKLSDEGTTTVARYLYNIDGRGHRVQMQEILPTGSPVSDTFLSDDERIAYDGGSWQTSSPFEISPNLDAALRLNFVGREIEVTLGTGPDHGICDVYLDRTLWGSVDTYAATSGEQVMTIEAYVDGLHVLGIRNRVEKNLASSGHRLSFKQVEVKATDYATRTMRYTYDTLSRLKQADYFAGAGTAGTPFRQHVYGYDLAGNRTMDKLYLNGVLNIDLAYTYNQINQLTGDGTKTHLYDDRGNLIGYDDGMNTYTTHTWDRANRLLQLDDGTDVYAYAYNGLGQRIRQALNPTGSNVITDYLLDVQPELAVVLTSNTDSDVTYYVHDPRGIYMQENSDSTWRWMVRDGLGSVRQVVDSDGDVLTGADFDPYGVVWQQAGTPQTPYGFTGEPTDENGLLYLRARYYDPMLAVFQNLDPLETPNRYAYVDGNPVNLVDSSGLSGQCAPQQQSECASEAALEGIFNTYGVTLSPANITPCWTDAMATDVIAAFNAVQINLSGAGSSFKAVFGNLNFVSSPNVDYGLTDSDTQVRWNLSSVEKDIEFQRVIVHELGHVLRYRTDHLLLNMDVIAQANTAQLRMPARGSVGTFDAEGQGQNPVSEAVADYFMFWVYEAFRNDRLGQAAKIYMEGGWIVHDLNLDIDNERAYPFSILQEMVDTNPELTRIARFIRDQLGSTGTILISPGIEYWLRHSAIQ